MSSAGNLQGPENSFRTLSGYPLFNICKGFICMHSYGGVVERKRACKTAGIEPKEYKDIRLETPNIKPKTMKLPKTSQRT